MVSTWLPAPARPAVAHFPGPPRPRTPSPHWPRPTWLATAHMADGGPAPRRRAPSGPALRPGVPGRVPPGTRAASRPGPGPAGTRPAPPPPPPRAGTRAASRPGPGPRVGICPRPALAPGSGDAPGPGAEAGSCGPGLCPGRRHAPRPIFGDAVQSPESKTAKGTIPAWRPPWAFPPRCRFCPQCHDDRKTSRFTGGTLRSHSRTHERCNPHSATKMQRKRRQKCKQRERPVPQRRMRELHEHCRDTAHP